MPTQEEAGRARVRPAGGTRRKTAPRRRKKGGNHGRQAEHQQGTHRRTHGEFGKTPNDSGSAEVQVAILTERIRNLTEHLKVHKKDKHTQRGLMMLIGKRRGLLKYVKERNIDEYRALIKKLGIRDNI